MFLFLMFFVTINSAYRITDTKTYTCYNVSCLSTAPHSTESVILKDSCDFEVFNLKKFSNNFPRLKEIIFDPLCTNCLKIDSEFNGIKIQGRCLETSKEQNVDLSLIINEIFACFILLLLISILSLLKFIKKEILRHFSKDDHC